MKVSIGDVDLWFDVAGSSLTLNGSDLAERPTIILLHGGPGYDHTIFKPRFNALAHRAQVIFLDQRGHGRSDEGDPEAWRLDRWADDVAAFCDRLGIRKPILLGHSFGGFVALATAARHPDLASGLIVLSAAAYTDRALTTDRFRALGGPDAEAAAKGLFANPDDPAAMADFMERCLPLYAADLTQMMACLGKAIVRPAPQARFFTPGGEFGAFDYRRELASCHVPTLIVQGGLDPINPPETAIVTVETFPRGVAQLVVIEDASHDLIAERWSDVAPIVTDFIDALPHRSR